MGISQYYKTELQHRIEDLYSTNRKRRPMQLDIREGIDCLFRLVRTGMQWREVNIASVSYITLFKHVHRWVDAGLFQATYASLLARYATGHDQKYYIVDSSHVKNAYGRQGLGRSPVDRGRKGLKISILADAMFYSHFLKKN